MFNPNRSGWIIFVLALFAFLSGAIVQYMLFRPAGGPVLFAASQHDDSNVTTSPLSDPLQEPCPNDAGSDTTLIDINNASAAQLTQLPGIGPAYAERIIAMRKLRDGFRYKEELLDVSGIGPARFAQIVDLITVGSYEVTDEQ